VERGEALGFHAVVIADHIVFPTTVPFDARENAGHPCGEKFCGSCMSGDDKKSSS